MEIINKAEGGGTTRVSLDAHALEEDLRQAVEGEVRFDNGSRALYATDGSNYRQVPVGVVVPRSNQDIVATVECCRRYRAPVLARGGGTSLAGQCCNVAVIIDASKYLRGILELDPKKKRARVQPGLVLDHLRREAEKHALTFGPDPSTHDHCTLGGMIGNNSCGTHALMAGKTVDNIEALKILTYDGLQLEVGPTSDEELERIIREGGRRGEIYAQLKGLRDRYAALIRQRFPNIPRRVSGYNLDQLLPENGFHVARALVGTESTCALFLEATCRLVDSPQVRSLLVLGYPDVFAAADSVMDVLAYKPIGLEGIDDQLVEDMKDKNLHPKDSKLLPKGRGWLIAEFGGSTREESDGRAREAMDGLKKHDPVPSMKLIDDPKEEHAIWEIRESGLGATAFVPGAPLTWEGWEDSAVPPDNLGRYLRSLRKLLEQYQYRGDLYGHFGQGCVHTRIDFNLETKDGIQKYRSFAQDAARLVVSLGGSLSGEHGDGQSRGELLHIMFGDELVGAFREFKKIWDPEWKMNPGKIVDPYRLDENLRLGTDYQPRTPQTHFAFPNDSGNFARAALRCVGVGNCRHSSGGVMCPSYMATLEEKHSTRGRARMLFEMLEGDVIKDGWREKSVFEALDLCLSCKGCRGECPVNVDMATYKAEFLSHYYEGRLRPIHAYSIGLIHRWARLASHFPRLVNLATHAPGLEAIIKGLGGFAQQRKIPAFSPYTFKQAFERSGAPETGPADRHEVILWPDTFNNYFHPKTAEAAVEVLASAGFSVHVPMAPLCCGRPLYDYGMLDLARKQLREILSALRREIRSGTPVVVLEPSCASVFRDELVNMFPHDEDALRLSQQTFLLSELLDQRANSYQPPLLRRKAIVHGHCHHKALMKMTAEENILKKMGLDYKLLDSGCCGMAGGFGFEKEHYGISVKVGERVLLPAVREAEPDTLLVADGFSCREQIVQMTGRQAIHLAEVIKLALEKRQQPGVRRQGESELANPGGAHEVQILEPERRQDIRPDLRDGG